MFYVQKKGCHASIIYQLESKGMPSVVSHKACVRLAMSRN